MTSDSELKENLIRQLNQQNPKSPKWIDGDKDMRSGSKVDIINHNLKIAIEIKNEPTGGQSLEKTNKQYGDYLRSAYRKFKKYPEYKTVLLINGTCFSIPGIMRYAINGLNTYGRQHVYLGKKNKYSSYIKREIGCFIIFADKRYYFPNKYAVDERILNKNEIEKIFGIPFQEVK